MATILLPGQPGRFPNYERALQRAGLSIGHALEDCDALLLPGGGDVAPWRTGAAEGLARGVDEARDALELELTAQFLALGRPILGVCRGMQVLNTALGGTLLQHIEGHQAIDGVDGRHASSALPGSHAARLYGTSFTINSAHHQAVDRLGQGLRAVQWSPEGIIESMEHETLPVWGVQWHPERLELPDGQKIYDLFGEEVEKYLREK